MDRNKAIKELQLTFKKLLKFADEIKFNSLVLSDGTQITIKGDDIAVGVEVMQLDDQGNQTPLNPGTYVLQDGRNFTVDETNKITEIGAPDDSGDEASSGSDTDNVETKKMDTDGLPSAHDGDPKTGEDVQPDTAVDGDMNSRMEDLEKQMAEVVNFLQQLQNSQQEVNEQMMHKIKRIGSEGDIEPIKPKKGYEGYKNIDPKVQSEDITRNFLDKIRTIKMKKVVEKPVAKVNGFKKLLAEADSQIKKQTLAAVETKVESAKPTNQKTESFLNKIRKNKK